MTDHPAALDCHPKRATPRRSRRILRAAATALILLSAQPMPRLAADPASALTAASGGSAADTVVVDPATQQILDGALRYLAAKQSANGSWSGPGGQWPIALTGYGLIAFMANGQLPGTGPYGDKLSRAVNFLSNCVHADGFIGGPYTTTSMYEHGVATIALAELYGQTHDENLRPKVAKAIQLIESCQNDQGGWRYRPVKADADISVTVLQVVALRSAKNSGFDVPQSVIDRAVKYVKSCYDAPSGGFTYQPNNHTPGFARTAAAIYSLQVCGLYDDPLVKKGSDYLFKNLENDQEWFTYGNFYAAPAQYMIGGDTWKKWYTTLHGMLLRNVRREGQLTYFDPIGGNGINSVYATEIYSTVLAMPYHYIPLYQR
ncbi:MAG TPA: prenyltransferase/squalene oxidase repeat-containing protein [Tepidisphaeraceae bacterium]|jgi:hypothetical protein|nr:prenyltransferase/squalene oxidase repeat-containing protein [Tepidisphaeraceae bacterium]